MNSGNRPLVHIRGDIGNQVIQAYVGTAIMAESNIKEFDYSFNFSQAQSESDNETTLKKNYLNQIFQLDNSVNLNPESTQETKYSFHGSAYLIRKHYEYLQNKLPLIKSIERGHEALVHVSKISNELKNDMVIYNNIIRIALSKHDNVSLIGDNKTLLQELRSLYLLQGIKLGDHSSSERIEDWFTLLSSYNIYTTPNSFAFSTKVLNQRSNIFVINPLDYTSSKYSLNEYLIIYELKKYFSGINILNSFTTRTSSTCHTFISNLLPIIDSKKYEPWIGKPESNIESFIQKLTNSVPETLLDLLASDYKYGKIIDYQSKTSLPKIKDYIMSFMDNLQINNSPITNQLNRAAISGEKHLNKSFYPPIIEESGFSITRHLLFTLKYILSRYNYSLSSECKYPELVNRFINIGYIILPNFLSNDAHKDTISLINNNPGSLSKTPTTLLGNIFRESIIHKALTSEKMLLMLSELTGYSKETIKNELIANTFHQQVNISPYTKPADPQQLFHIDTFYPAFKFWYFPFNVSTDSAPFEYVPFSHLPSGEILNHHQEAYKSNAYNKGMAISKDNSEGSLRATDNDIYRMGLNSTYAIAPANSLVIANVHGFHRRGKTTKEVQRNSIHSSIRPKDIFNSDIYIN